MIRANHCLSNFRNHWQLYSCVAAISTVLILLAFYNLGYQFRGMGSLGSTILFTGGIALAMTALALCCKKKKFFLKKIEMVDGYYVFSNQQEAELASKIMIAGQCLPFAADGIRGTFYYNGDFVPNEARHQNIVPRYLLTRFIHLPPEPPKPEERKIPLNHKDLEKYRDVLRGNEFFRAYDASQNNLIFYFKEGVVPQKQFNGNGEPIRFEVIKLRYSNHMKHISFWKYLKSLI